jgi:hypothetical protein
MVIYREFLNGSPLSLKDGKGEMLSLKTMERARRVS